MKKWLILAALLLAPFGVNSQQSQVTLFYVATAVDSTGTESDKSNETTAIVTPTHKTINLSWVASTSTVSGYNMYRARVSGGPYAKVNATLITGTTFVDTFSFPAPPTALTNSVP